MNTTNLEQSVVCVLGMPGAGKTTLCKAMEKEAGLEYVETGAVARNLAKVDHETEEALAAGQMAPRDKMNTAMREVLFNAINLGKSIAFDAWPRYEAQYDDLIASNFPIERMYFLLVGCNDDMAMNRLRQRGRTDDVDDKVIKQRIKNFWIETYPVYTLFHTRHAHNTIHIPIGTQRDVLNHALQYLKGENVVTWPRPVNHTPQVQSSSSSTNTAPSSPEPKTVTSDTTLQSISTGNLSLKKS